MRIKIVFNNEQNASFVSNNSSLNKINKKVRDSENWDFQIPKVAVKPNVTNRTKSNIFFFENRFECLNNGQFESSISFNIQIAHNVASSNSSTNSKKSNDYISAKEQSKEPVTDTEVEFSKTGRTETPKTIMVDSMIRKVFGNKLSRSPSKYHLAVWSFGGAKTQCMKDNIKPTIKLAVKQILHCITNNQPSKEEPETIANSMMNLAKNVRTDTTKFALFGVITRRDT